VELVIQMLVVFVVKQLLSMATEMGLPTAAELQAGKQRPPQPQWEEDWALAPSRKLHLFDEYLEMVLQFGFLTLFMAAMPLAPMFALLNNVMELRLDAWKMLRLMRRPLARRASDIGAWEQILSSLGALSLVTNAVVVGFTSEQVPRLVYRLTASNGSFDGYIEWRLSSFNTADFEAASQVANSSEAICYYRDFRQPEPPYNWRPEHWHVLAARLSFVLVFEHLVLALRALVMRLVPRVPAGVRREIRRERRFLRKALFRQMHQAESKEAEAAV
uniref:Anoctamin n=1 Tax=Macrostomum lignano TaxID=282301 RepID=A0A1I8IHG9_9PLAT